MTTLENKKLIRRYVEEVWNSHNPERTSEFVADSQLAESVEHTRQFLAAFPDVQVTIEVLIAEGDKVVGRYLARGTNSGPYAGQSPTGKTIQFTSIRIYRIAPGKIVETWAMQDRLGLMEQLGMVQSVGGVNWAAGKAKRPG
jgi:predicted ester cyclase